MSNLAIQGPYGLEKIALGLLLLGATFVGGMFYGKGEVETITVEKIVTKEGETKTVYRDRIVTVTKVVHPDGTTEETTKTEEKDKTTEKKKKETDVAKDTTVTPILAKYSLGLGAKIPIDAGIDKYTRPDYSATIGYRILGPTWVEIGGSTDKQVTLGIRVEL